MHILDEINKIIDYCNECCEKIGKAFTIQNQLTYVNGSVYIIILYTLHHIMVKSKNYNNIKTKF